MIYELSQTDFRKCRQLLNPSGQVEAKSVIRGTHPGRVFVDDLKEPSTGLIWRKTNDGFYFIGNEQNNQFNNHINEFFDTLGEADVNKLEVVGNHEGWDTTLDELFTLRETSSWTQVVYTLKDKHDLPALPQLIRNSYQLKEITPELFFNNTYEIHNIAFLQSKIATFWPSPEDFFDSGIGYCILDGHTIVSLCFSSFVFRQTHCIDIETLNSHQNKQLAQFAAYAFVQRCIYESAVPYWDCLNSDTISQKVARKIGLTQAFTYKGLHFSIK